MMYLLWLMPAAVILAGILSGRIPVAVAVGLGLLTAIPICLFAAPAWLGMPGLMHALARGAWIGALITPYILGGLIFWQVASSRLAAPGTTLPHLPPASSGVGPRSRHLLFFAALLVGPFAEGATGFGVGMLGTISLLGGLGLAPPLLMRFALLSQVFVPWGAMGSGTLLASAYAGIPAADLGLYTLVPIGLLQMVWLPLFWHTTARAGFQTSLAVRATEIGWTLAGLCLLALCTRYLGPETAMLCAYGPLLTVYYLIHLHDRAHRIGRLVLNLSPFILLVTVLFVTRSSAHLSAWLSGLGRLRPYPSLPAWSPFFHAGTWLLGIGVAVALASGRGRQLPGEVAKAWRTGGPAIQTVFLFSMMAEVLTGAGVSRALADALFLEMGKAALLMTPLVSGLFGWLANTGNAPNSLFMPSQVVLAANAGLSLGAVAAIQHASGNTLSVFSPVRMSIAASLSGGVGRERAVLKSLVPFALAALLLLVFLAMLVLILNGGTASDRAIALR